MQQVAFLLAGVLQVLAVPLMTSMAVALTVLGMQERRGLILDKASGAAERPCGVRGVSCGVALDDEARFKSQTRHRARERSRSR